MYAQNFKGNLNNIRNATAPHRNTLSHANRTRDIALIKKLFWKIVVHYQQTHPNFFTQGGRSYFRLPRRFKRAIRAIDSTTIELIAKCMDWAKHRKHKAAAKVHVALDLISFIPIRVVTDSANHHDGSYMSELCGNMKPGDIAVMDRAYVDYVQLNTLTEKIIHTSSNHAPLRLVIEPLWDGNALFLRIFSIIACISITNEIYCLP